ncbi:MAG: hypothetical protein AMXMBFR56_65960 [Polyangiaceae bacterium]
MSGPLNHEKRNRRQTREAVIEAKRDAELLASSSRDARNAYDQAFLMDILNHPKLDDSGRVKCERSLAWLREVRTRTLGEAWVKSFKRLATALRLRDEGIYQPSDPAKVQERIRRDIAARAAKAEARRLPAWMGDPSLLPKLPPGRGAS